MALDRRSHAKVRTGCRTCKTRRIKCDETRPACLRCIKSRYICEGYSITFTTPQNSCPKAGEHEFLVYTFRQNDIRPVDSAHFYQTLQTLADLSDPDYRAYDFCRRYTMHEMASHHLTRFWTHTVLSASHDEPAVLHALLALTGVHRDYCESPVAASITRPSNTIVPAYAHYGKAIAHLKNRMPTTTRDFRDLQVVLMVCLILHTFDVIQGRYNEACLHLDYGRTILKDLHPHATVTTTPLKNTATELYLPSKPSSALDELTYSFALMDVQSISFGSAALHFRITDSPDPEYIRRSPKLPPRFDTIDDAWRSMLIIVSEANHFAFHCRKFNDMESSTLLILQGRLLASLRDWKAAFENSPFRTASGTSRSSETSDRLNDHNRAAYLRLQHKFSVAVISMGLCLSSDEMVYDQLLPDFAELVSLCEGIVPAALLSESITNPKRTITLEATVIPALYTIISHCRHPDIRRRGLQVLARAGREGYWDGKQTEFLMKDKMLMEEEDAGFVYDPDHFLPEDPVLLAQLIPRSARWSEMTIDFLNDNYTMIKITHKRKRLDSLAVYPISGGTDGYEIREKIIDLTLERT